jgi:hypothetical protein
VVNSPNDSKNQKNEIMIPLTHRIINGGEVLIDGK